MKNIKTIQENVKKDLKLSDSDTNNFIMNAKRYIKATKEGRMLCIVDSVSKSGTSRTLKFMECNGSIKNGFRYYNFFNFFKDLGHANVKHSNTFRISGCGMDMVFATNYNNIHTLHNLGL